MAKTLLNQIEPQFGEEEKKALLDYLNSGGWLTEFEKTREFERMLANYLGCRYACVVSNGTAALTASLMALGITRPDEVLVPDLTLIVDANVVLTCGATPVLIDIDKKSLCSSLELVKGSMSSAVKAIILVSLNGRSADVEAIVEYAKERGIHVIEDAAQSLGSKHSGRYLGTFGDVGCFSFSMPKIVTTGQGGAVVTDDAEIFDKVRRIKDFGRPRSGVDYHDIVGLNFKFTDLQAVIGIEQMKRLDRNIARKRSIFSIYREVLRDVPSIEFVDTDLSHVTPWYVDILLASSRIKSGLVNHLQSAGIKTRPFYPPIHTQPPYAHARGRFPVSTWASECGLWLPSSLTLEDNDIRYVSDAIRDFLKN
jgi:perosamine synthetase